jgi:hypothetical protein
LWAEGCGEVSDSPKVDGVSVAELDDAVPGGLQAACAGAEIAIRFVDHAVAVVIHVVGTTLDKVGRHVSHEESGLLGGSVRTQEGDVGSRSSHGESQGTRKRRHGYRGHDPFVDAAVAVVVQTVGDLDLRCDLFEATACYHAIEATAITWVAETSAHGQWRRRVAANPELGAVRRLVDLAVAVVVDPVADLRAGSSERIA